MSSEVIVHARLDDFTKGMLRDRLRGAVDAARELAKRDILEYAREITPRRTGRLAESFDVSILGQSIVMKWATEYAKVVDEGAVAHVIEAKKRGGVLRWWDAGGMVHFARRVRHPGFAGSRFSEHMRMVAPEFLKERLVEQLGMIQP